MEYVIKEFIEDNIDLIEEKDWDTVYDNAVFNLDSTSVGLFTVAMLKAGLNPIEEAGLDYIPSYYLSDVHLVSTKIPDGIHLLSEGCYCYSKLEKITIPESVEEIGDYVFYGCASLKEVTVLGHIRSVGSQVFHDCHEDLVIRCKEGSVMDMYAQDCNLTVEYI